MTLGQLSVLTRCFLAPLWFRHRTEYTAVLFELLHTLPYSHCFHSLLRSVPYLSNLTSTGQSSSLLVIRNHCQGIPTVPSVSKLPKPQVTRHVVESFSLLFPCTFGASRHGFLARRLLKHLRIPCFLSCTRCYGAQSAAPAHQTCSYT